MEELIRVRTKKADAWIMLLTRQRELSKKTEAQQMAVIHTTEGLKLLKMTAEDDVEAYMEAFEWVALVAR